MQTLPTFRPRGQALGYFRFHAIPDPLECEASPDERKLRPHVRAWTHRPTEKTEKNVENNKTSERNNEVRLNLLSGINIIMSSLNTFTG